MKISIIGAGNMGEAIIKGFNSKNVTVSDKSKNRLKTLRKKQKITVVKNNIEAVKKSSIIILAVKPQDMNSVLKEIRKHISNKQLIISIAAGVKTRKIEKIIGKRVAVIRVMPNTPALIGEGISVLCKGRYAKVKDIKKAREIFRRTGKVLVIKNEGLMDAVTAISGSGPAYICLFIESLIKSANILGLRRFSDELVIQTFKGAIKLLEESKKSPKMLRKQVTSPGGTTEAALKVFGKKKVQNIIIAATKAAYKRSKKLSK